LRLPNCFKNKPVGVCAPHFMWGFYFLCVRFSSGDLLIK
jgi:hypothetical protein